MRGGASISGRAGGGCCCNDSGGGGGGVAELFAGVLNINSDTVLTEAENGYLISVDTSGGNVQVTMPAAAPDLAYVFANRGLNAVNIVRAGTDTIDGATGRAASAAFVYGTLWLACQTAGLWQRVGGDYYSKRAEAGANSDITSLSGLSTPLSATQGGTNLNGCAAGDILVATSANTWGVVANVADGQVLCSSRSAGLPAYGKVRLTGSPNDVTGVLPLTSGGTGETTAGGARFAILPSYTGNALKVLQVNAGETDAEWATAAAGIGGSLGTIDNGIPRADGTGGVTSQGSKFAIGDAGGANFYDNSGGNARGNNAVHFQTSRSAATQVASGANSFLAGGSGSTCSAQYGFVGAGLTLSCAGTAGALVGGFNNSITAGQQGFIGGGSSITVSADSAAAVGGGSHTVSGSTSVALGGTTHSNSGSGSVTMHYHSAASKAYCFVRGAKGSAGHYGATVVGANWQATAGDQQWGDFTFSITTSNATITELLLLGVSGERFVLVDGDSYDCELWVSAKASGANWASWRAIQFNISRAGSTTTITGAGTGAGLAPTDSAGSLAAALLDVTADDTNDRLYVAGTGITATNALWTGVLFWVRNKVA